MKKTVLATLAIAAILGGSTGFAANVAERIGGQGIYLDPSASNRYLEMIHNHLLDIGVDPEMSAFSIPATSVTYVKCTPGGMGNPCFKLESVTVKLCPTTIPVKWPDGTYKDVAVTCVGPDAQGNCECEIK